jgi:hypothetical protein
MPLNLLKKYSLSAVSAALIFLPGIAMGASLGSYNVEPNHISISGVSSGGYMATQMQVAYSATFRGAGIIAGGPYYCAEGSLIKAMNRCMRSPDGLIYPMKISKLVSKTNRLASSGAIDATSNLSNHKIYMYSAKGDTTVVQKVMDYLKVFYLAYVPSANIIYNNSGTGEHAMVTDDWGGTSCRKKASPYIANCEEDAAGILLNHIHGTLKPPHAKPDSLWDKLKPFDQDEFISRPQSGSMADTGYVYIPTACESGASCGIHVALHGCKQYREAGDAGGKDAIGDVFIKNAGYNEWGETNNIIILYPQTVPTGLMGGNPNGCWDWWGYKDANYHVKSGKQMLAIKKMIDRLASGGDHPINE